MCIILVVDKTKQKGNEIMRYIIVREQTHQYGSKYAAYENFKQLKEAVIDRLDGRGWDDKSQVNLNSIESCLSYLHSDGQGFSYKITHSYNKYSECRDDRLGSRGYCYRHFVK